MKTAETQPFRHVMVDVETLGDRSRSVITSIGAILFDPSLGLAAAPPFYRNIDIQDCLDKGLRVTGDTLKWWFNQDPEVVRKMFEDPKPLTKVLQDFKVWFNYHGGVELTIWSKSPRFDLGLLRDACEVCGIAPFWDFRKERDSRTYTSIIAWSTALPNRFGAIHDPVADAYHQAEQVCITQSLINVQEPILQE